MQTETKNENVELSIKYRLNMSDCLIDFNVWIDLNLM